YGDAATRNAYPNTARYRSGHFQPDVNGGKATVQDVNTAVVKYFYKADTLFLGFDVRDQVVQSVAAGARWDGFTVTLCHRNVFEDGSLRRRELSFRVGGSGTSVTTGREHDLATTSGSWDSSATRVQVAIALKGGTTIDTVGALPDSGYTAEMRVRLDSLGYPAGRGDGLVFLAVKHYDGDSFTPATQSYGTHTWFMRENAFIDGSAWAWMNPAITLAVDEKGNQIPDAFTLAGNYPNPFNPSTTIRFVMPQRSEVTLEVFNVLGQLVAIKTLGERQAGEHNIAFDASNLATGLYNYRLTMAATKATVAGKMMLVK
ncbi:MAG: T9SS type A sorting domain-containing protein, partial [Bacteroidota bacterium]